MNKEEFAVFAMLLKTAYPRENVLPNKQSMEMWYRMLKHIPYKTAEVMLQKWIGTNKWPPTIAEILDSASKLTYGETPDWSEGWAEVQKAISRYGYTGEDEAYDSFSPTTAKVVGRLGFRNLCMSENPIADRANFRTCYEVICKREQEDRNLPPELKAVINDMLGGSDALSLPDTRESGNKEELTADGTESEDKAMVSRTIKGIQSVSEDGIRAFRPEAAGTY